MDEAVQNCIGVGGVPEYLIIPLILIGESLKFRPPGGIKLQTPISQLSLAEDNLLSLHI